MQKSKGNVINERNTPKMEQYWISLILLFIGSIYSVQSQLYEYGTSNGDIEVTTVNDGWKQINLTKDK